MLSPQLHKLCPWKNINVFFILIYPKAVASMFHKQAECLADNLLEKHNEAWWCFVFKEQACIGEVEKMGVARESPPAAICYWQLLGSFH